MRTLALSFSLVAVSGCSANFDETTLVRIRSAKEVAVGAFTPEGYRELLSRGDEPATVEVPTTKPPLNNAFPYAHLSSVQRYPGGEVDIDCPTCGIPYSHAHVVDAPEIALKGAPETTVAWSVDGAVLGIRSPHAALRKCRKVPGMCPVEAVSLALATPRENVVEIRHRAIVGDTAKTGGWVALVAGTLFFGAGAALFTATAVDRERVTVSSLVPGVPFMLVGGTFIATGIRWLLARDHEDVVYPRSR